MAYNRRVTPLTHPDTDTLAGALAGRGVSIAVTPIPDHNIEDTVLAASRAGMEDDDYRILGLLVAWLDVHSARLNADRLIQLVRHATEPRVRAFWRAMARRWSNDRRWRRLARLVSTPTELLRTGNAFQIRRRGEDPRFVDTGLLVPVGVLRQRPGDVQAPAAVCQLHRAYRWRTIIGPSYRADVWAALESDGAMTASLLARKTYAGFATAWQARRDFVIVHT